MIAKLNKFRKKGGLMNQFIRTEMEAFRLQTGVEYSHRSLLEYLCAGRALLHK